jgi:glyoxylase-like metal-dependent hydrolase (beta-lactamase superfamily II)
LATPKNNSVRYVFDNKPATGEAMPVVPGIHWLRLPLPFDLNHINVWLLQDGTDWTIVDTGIASDESKDAWRQVFNGVMAGRRASQVIATHLHPDHIGCAGWLTRKFDADLHMTREEYMLARVLVADTGKPAPEEGVRFYRAAGFPEDELEAYRKRFGFFGRLVSRLPESYLRLHENDVLHIGKNRWRVLIGRGHSPEHACLLCEDANLLIAGDQVLPTISANVSVWPTEPEANPLRYWLRSLAHIKSQIPADVVVLPAHGKPFQGAHERIEAIIDEHRSRLDDLREFCEEPCRAIDTFAVLYKRRVPGSHTMMATGEAIAHLHYLIAEGEVNVERDEVGVDWYRRR